MDVIFLSIDDSQQTAMVSIGEHEIGSGAQGSVYQARIAGDERYCVKVLTGIASGEVGNEIALFQQMRARTKAQLDSASTQGALRSSAEVLLRYLPDFVAFEKLPGYERAELLLARPYCPGTPLHELLTDPDYENADPLFRISLARQEVRQLVAMELAGCLHLDCYPDNVVVESNGNFGSMRVAMIDLEGAGMLAPALAPEQASQRWSEEFERAPRSISKDGFWDLPWWYPTEKTKRAVSDWFVEAARYQMLALTTLTLTWGSTPGCWLEDQARHELGTYANQLRKSASAPTDIDREVMASCLERIDRQVEQDFIERCGNTDLAHQLMSWFNAGFLGPNGKNWTWFTGLELQRALNVARV